MKSVLKHVAVWIAMLVTAPMAACYCLAALILGKQCAFVGWSQAVSLFPGTLGNYLRGAFYRWVLPRCDQGSVVSFGTVFSHPTVEIGRSAYVGVYCCLGDVTLEDDVLVGSHVSITNGCRQHGIERLDIPVREQPGEWPRVTIGRDSWIGDRAVVMADVGRHCVVGAGAVVTKAVPDYAIVAGVPAKIIGSRGKQERGTGDVDERRAAEVLCG
jgi:acetyltransferase-like isoleucine patch superfamily enzyme